MAAKARMTSMATRRVSEIERRMKGFYNQSQVYQRLLSSHEDFRRNVALDRYVSFVSRYGLRKDVVLDLGCGTGETTRRLAAKGYNVIGIDISSLFLKPLGLRDAGRHLNFVVGDIVRLPFHDESVSCVALHDVIEHVPDTDRLLSEIMRVLRVDGRVIIVSPNLLSPIKPIRHILGMEGFNTRFYGSRLNAICAIFLNISLLVAKLLTGKPDFMYRTPLLGDDFQCPDDDAVYMANMIDLKKWFQQKGFKTSYVYFATQQHTVSDRLKSKIFRWLPWLDKGFSLVVQRAN